MTATLSIPTPIAASTPAVTSLATVPTDTARIYVHRLGGDWYGHYMDGANEAALAEFSDFVCDGTRSAAMDEDELIARMQGCTAILSLGGGGAHEITPRVLRAVGTVQAICIGHWCGQLVGAAAEVGIPLVEGSNANTVAVAEWTMAAALLSIRQLHTFDTRLKSGSPWAEPRRSVGLLRETSVGLVGLGRIGKYVARMFRMLGVDVMACDALATPADAAGLDIRLGTLDEVLATSDLISLHLPVLPSTRGLIDARALARMRDGAVFINSARAALCDEDALTRELQSGRISAVLDVFAVEPLPLDHPLRRLDNVIITPHLAGDNDVMFRRCSREAIATLRNFFAGRGLHDRRFAFP